VAPSVAPWHNAGRTATRMGEDAAPREAERDVLDDQQHTELAIGGRYRIDQEIAAGALCRVHRGTDAVLRRPVAIKVVPPAAVPTYRRALQMTAQLTHPAIVATFDAVERDGDLFVVQEYVQARPFETYLRNGLPVERAADLAGQLARALAYSHAHGVVHGDLTPAALLVDRRAAVRINNFCLPPDQAYFSDAAATLEPGLAGIQPQSDDPSAGEVNDVRAVGLILWRALTAEQREATGPGLRAVRDFRDDVPEAARALVRRCLGTIDEGAIRDAEALALALDALGRELARSRPALPEETPPALRVAREMVAREAGWSLDDTLGMSASSWAPERSRRTPPGVVDLNDATVPTVHPGPGVPAREPRVTAGPARLALPARPEGRGDMAAARTPARTAPPVWAAPDEVRRRPPAAKQRQGSISLPMVIAIGVVLFLVFFVVGFATALR
jgi:Protein kinase domain